MCLFGEEVYRSFDSADADRSADVLWAAGIKAQRRTIDLVGPFMRTMDRTDNFAINESRRYVYVVKVAKRNVSQAEYILRNLHN